MKTIVLNRVMKGLHRSFADRDHREADGQKRESPTPQRESQRLRFPSNSASCKDPDHVGAPFSVGRSMCFSLLWLFGRRVLWMVAIKSSSRGSVFVATYKLQDSCLNHLPGWSSDQRSFLASYVDCTGMAYNFWRYGFFETKDIQCRMLLSAKCYKSY